eukprot:scaffold27679_cov49-Attheya_sp.AAC.3
MVKKTSTDDGATQPSSYAFIGDMTHVIVLLSTIIFAVMVGLQMNSAAIGIFDPIWKEQGFCISNPDKRFFTSHDMCLYFDVLASGVLGLVYWKLQKSPGMEIPNDYMKSGIPGIVGHGIGHGAIAAGIRALKDETGEESEMGTLMEQFLKEPTPLKIAFSVIPLVLFWLTLLKGTMPNVKKWSTVATIMVPVFIVQMFIPNQFGFTYVQTVLFVAFSGNQLALKPDKKDNIAYALYPVVVGFPVTLVGWMESTQCTAFVRDFFYGHLIYDAYIPVAMLFWYVFCYLQAAPVAAAESKKKAE